MLALLQFDSASLPVIERLLADGRLPVLDGLRRRGSWETMDADATILQSATLPSLYTGIDVREHGIYSAFPWSAREQRARHAHTVAKPRTIWERLTQRGRRALVIDPYLAWAPSEMCGVFLSGLGFEDRMVLPRASRPSGMMNAVERRHGRSPRLDDVYGAPDAASLLALRTELVASPARVANAVRDLLSRERFDLLWVNFAAAHKAGHHLWDPAAVVDGGIDEATARHLRAGLEEVYVAVDGAIGHIVDALPDDADVTVFSPTGMDANTSRADLLPGMLDAVMRGAARQGTRARRSPIWWLRSRLPVRWRSWIARAMPDRAVADLTTRLYMRGDWSSTRALAVPGENKGYVRLNLKGRELHGIVEPRDADALMREIAEGLSTFRDPDGSVAIERVRRMTEVARGERYSDRLPDLVVYWGERAAARLDEVRSERYGVVRRSGVGSGRSGNHVDDAWAIVVPRSSRLRGLDRPLRVTDIGATACRLLGADASGLSGESFLEPCAPPPPPRRMDPSSEPLRLRERVARALWHAHPARPGGEYAFLRDSQWWPRDRLEEFQARALRDLVRLASGVPFYAERFRAAGVGAADIRSIEDLARLPVLEREELERLGADGLRVPRSWGMRAFTSGSSGRRVGVLWPLAQMRWLDAGEARARAWLGSEVGERKLEVRCRPMGLPQRVSALLLNAEALHAPTVSDPRVVRSLVRSLENQRAPTLVWGVSNALYVVALALLEEDHPLHARACWSGGNHLHPHYRQAMERAFQCTVYERYATMEMGLIAHECVEGRSLHVPAEGIIAEIVRSDGSAAAPGETGDVLLTSLRNDATPLIRYRVGDRAVAPTSSTCSCGRGLPLFGTVAGRRQDFLRTADGDSVGPREAVDALWPAIESLVDFQAVQERDGTLEVRVVQRTTAKSHGDLALIAATFDAMIRPPRPTRVVRVDRIALTPGGKLRTLISGHHGG